MNLGNGDEPSIFQIVLSERQVSETLPAYRENELPRGSRRRAEAERIANQALREVSASHDKQ